MLIVRALLVVVCLLSLSPRAVAAPTEEMVLVERSQATMQKLIAFTKQSKARLGGGPIEGAARTRLIVDIEQLLSRERNPAVLARVALLTRAHVDMGQGAGALRDETVEEVFVEAWIVCMTRIRKIGGTQAMQALDDLQRGLANRGVDGALGLAFSKAREDVARGIEAKGDK